VEIKFSRHAKRRGKLYEISEETVRKILATKELTQGNQEIVENVEGYKYPLKIIVSVEADITTVITNYPVKKGK
jgi:hypothetical protein